MADTPDFIPDSQFTPDAGQTMLASAGPDFIPDSQFISDEEKYGGIGSKIGTFLEGGLEASTFGLSTGLEKHIGQKLGIEALKPEAIRGRRQTNEFEHGAGQFTGLITSGALLPGAGAAGLLEAGGAAAARAVGLGAAEGAAAKIGSTAVKSAVENMLVQGGDEVSKMFADNYHDPSEAVQTAAVNVGLSGLIGGGIGGVVGSISPLWEATLGRKTSGALQEFSNETEHVIKNGAFSELPEDFYQKKSLREAIASKKHNANEISAAMQGEGLTPQAGQLSDQKIVQNVQSELGKQGSFSGIQQAKDTKKIFDHIEHATENDILRDKTLKTQYEVGREIKNGVLGDFEKRADDLSARYDADKAVFKEMQVSPELKQAAVEKISTHPWAADPEYQGITNRWTERIQKIDSVDKLKETTTLLSKQIKAAAREGGPEYDILKNIKNSLRDMRASAINEAELSAGLKGAASGETIGRVRALDSEYAAFKKDLSEFSREAGTRNVNSAAQMLENFKKYSDEDFAKRLFDVNDLNQLNYVKEKFPKEFELARRYKLKELYENSLSSAQGENGKFQVGKFLRQAEDLNPEVKDILFAGKSERLGRIKTIFESMPGNGNPPNTAAAMKWGSLLTPQGILDNAADAIKYAMLKRLPELMEAAGSKDAKATGLAAMVFLKSGQPVEGSAFKSAVDYISQTMKGENLIGKATKGVFRASEQVLPTKLIPDDKSREKLDKKLKELQTNQDPLFDVGGKTAHYLPQHGGAMAETAVRAVDYLNSLRPVAQKQSPLDPEPLIDKAQKTAFNKALDIAQQPLLVLDDVKNGTVSVKDITTLSMLYPSLYTRLSSKLYNEMIEAVNAKEPIPYKTAMGVSLFLGNPLETTLKPDSIQALQATFLRASPNQQKQAQQQGSSGGGAHSMKALAKLPGQYATPLQAREAAKLKA